MGVVAWFFAPILLALFVFLGGVSIKKANKLIHSKKEAKAEIEAKQKRKMDKQKDLEKAAKSLARNDIEVARRKAELEGSEYQEYCLLDREDQEEKTIYDFLPNSYEKIKEGEYYKGRSLHSEEEIERYKLKKEDFVFVQELYPKMLNEIYSEEAGGHELDTEFGILEDVRKAHMRNIVFRENGKKELADTAHSRLENDLKSLDSLVQNEVNEDVR